MSPAEAGDLTDLPAPVEISTDGGMNVQTGQLPLSGPRDPLTMLDRLVTPFIPTTLPSATAVMIRDALMMTVTKEPSGQPEYILWEYHYDDQQWVDILVLGHTEATLLAVAPSILASSLVAQDKIGFVRETSRP